MRPHVLVVTASLVAALAAPLHAARAQQASTAPSSLPIVPGARVRISATTLVAPLLANYLETKGDTAVFIEAGAGRGIWTFTLDQLTKIEQSAGDRRFNKRPMLIYAAIGAPVGALVIWGPTGLISPSDSTRKFNRTGTALAGAALGAVVGALIGSRVTEEHWMSLPLPRRVSFNPFRRDGRVDVGWSFSF